MARGVALGLGVAFLAAIGCNRGPGGWTEATYHKVKHGMSPAEVAAILGEGTEVKMEDISKLPGMEKFTPPPPGMLKVRDDNPPKEAEAPKAAAKGGGGLLGPEVPMKDIGSLKWIKYGGDDKYILLGFADDKMFDIYQVGVVSK
jgi:hypothetical protein